MTGTADRTMLIERVIKAIREHIDSDPSLRDKQRLLDSVPGLGERTIAVLLACPVVLVQVPRWIDAAQGAADARRIDRPAFSPYEPGAQEMFAAVRELTAGDDVVAFGAARAMTLFTDRRALQVRDLTLLPSEADWWVVAPDADGEFVAPDGAEQAWSNPAYALYRLP